MLSPVPEECSKLPGFVNGLAYFSLQEHFERLELDIELAG